MRRSKLRGTLSSTIVAEHKVKNATSQQVYAAQICSIRRAHSLVIGGVKLRVRRHSETPSPF